MKGVKPFIFAGLAAAVGVYAVRWAIRSTLPATNPVRQAVE